MPRVSGRQKMVTSRPPSVITARARHGRKKWKVAKREPWGKRNGYLSAGSERKPPRAGPADGKVPIPSSGGWGCGEGQGGNGTGVEILKIKPQKKPPIFIYLFFDTLQLWIDGYVWDIRIEGWGLTDEEAGTEHGAHESKPGRREQQWGSGDASGGRGL